MATWRERATEVIQAVIRGAIADGVSRDELIRRIDSSYPFGPRTHYPYTVWREVKRNLLYDGQETPRTDRGHRPPSIARQLYVQGAPDLFTTEETPHDRNTQ